MATKKKAPAKAKKPSLTAEQRAKLAEKAKQQWSDPNSKLRNRQKELTTKKPPRNAAVIVREAIAEFGACVTQLCEVLGCSRALFFEWLRRHPDLKQAYDEGRAVMEETLTSELYRQAMKGYAPAAMFLLKSKFHYRDSGPVADAGLESPQEKAAKIRELLKQMETADLSGSQFGPPKSEVN